MCQYRYYYYAGCRHQRTVLTKYCADAPIALAPPGQQRLQQQQQQRQQLRLQQQQPRRYHVPATANTLEDNGGSALDDVASASSVPALSSISTGPSSSPDTTTSDSHSSYRQYSLASISKLTADVTSLPLQPIRRRHSHTVGTGIDDMAAIPALTRPHWMQPHQLIVGTSAKIAQGDSQWAVLDHTGNVIHETHAQGQSKLSDVHNDQDHSIVDGHDPRSMQGRDIQTDHSSDDHSIESRNTFSLGREYDNMEIKLKAAQREIACLRNEARDSIIPEAESEAHMGQSPNPRSSRGCNTPTTVSAPLVSPAALLQREHEKAKLQQYCVLDVVMPDAPVPPPPSITDFPGLWGTDRAHQVAHENDNVATKPSYANMAFQGTTRAADPTRTKPVCSCAASYDPEVDDESIVTSPRSPVTGRTCHDPVSALKGTTSKKTSPRFAQPTAAHSRRADETIRKDSVANAGKPESQKPNLMSSVATRQQKRKSLPGDWLGNSPEQTAAPPAALTHTQSGDYEAQEIGTSPISALRKKTSTYMSPTKAATQRTIATIGQDATTPAAPRLHRNLTRLNTSTTSVMTTKTTLSQPSSPASPETTIETEMNFARALPTHFSKSETSKAIAPRRSTITAALPHSRQLPANTSIAEMLAQQARAAGLPMVANTTTQRRGSHGHLLIPIKAKLNKIGILKEDPHSANVRKNSELLSPMSQKSESNPFSPLARTMHIAEAKSSDISRIGMTENYRVDAAPGGRKAAVPPHVRAAMRDAAAREVVSAAGPMPNSVDKTPSLRATAQEFKPMLQQPSQEPLLFRSLLQQPQQPPHQLGLMLPQPGVMQSTFAQPQETPPADIYEQLPTLLDHSTAPAAINVPISEEDATRFYDAEEWLAMPAWVKRQICERRDQLRGGPSRFTSHVGNVLGAGQGMMSMQQPSCNLHGASLDVFDMKSINVQTGQVLVPRVDPVTQAVQWTLTVGGGNEIPINFGRAAPPKSASPSGAVFTPSSGYGSPRFVSPRTPGPLPRSWTIGSEQARQVYGWKGGDGREIKFVGHGPDAEREPGNVARLHYQRRVTSMGRGPRMIGDEGHDGSPEAPLAPRSRRHWAQLAGHWKQPCNKMEIVDAVEQMPVFGEALYGHCTDCAISSH